MKNPVAPVVRQLDRTIDLLDLIGAWHKFVAETSRLVPQLRGRRLSEDERELIHKNVDRARATCERLVSAVDSGHLDMDEELNKLLRASGRAAPIAAQGRCPPASTPKPSGGC
ncbi:DUF6192 family protein [Streptomyces syringium]|uniref:DUF6192 family protein n=1 Tax=Streptomyces syringium TaxID=76729 RepID=UPI003454DE7D